MHPSELVNNYDEVKRILDELDNALKDVVAVGTKLRLVEVQRAFTNKNFYNFFTFLILFSFFGSFKLISCIY